MVDDALPQTFKTNLQFGNVLDWMDVVREWQQRMIYLCRSPVAASSEALADLLPPS